MGRESCYCGQSVEWDTALKSNHRWGPTQYQFGPLPFPDVPTPGAYKFV